MSISSDLTYTPLFTGTDLSGWTQIPRSYGPLYPGGPDVHDGVDLFPADYQEQAQAHPARWTAEDGAVVGRQDPPGCGYGGYLLSDEDFGDFELVVEAKPDWPADTGIMIRRRPDSWAGLQILVDHRRSGSIGGFFGNGIASFHAVPFALDARYDDRGNAIGLGPDDPATSVEPFTEAKRAMLTRAAYLDEFLRGCVGALPAVTVWINDLLVAEIDLATLEAPNYDPQAVQELLGPAGRIAFEVHDNDPAPGLAEERWAPDAACRWRNARIARL